MFGFGVIELVVLLSIVLVVFGLPVAILVMIALSAMKKRQKRVD